MNPPEHHRDRPGVHERPARHTVTGRAHLTDGAHVVAVEPTSHGSYFPVPHGRDGRPAPLSFDPS